MKYNIGDKVRIKMYDHPYNGNDGEIVHINGEYHIVKLPKYYKNGYIEIECYRNELDLLVDILDVHKNNFQEELFTV
jgi:hypothetical protein